MGGSEGGKEGARDGRREGGGRQEGRQGREDHQEGRKGGLVLKMLLTKPEHEAYIFKYYHSNIFSTNNDIYGSFDPEDPTN